MKRVFVYLSALVGLGGMLYLAGRGVAQGPAPTPPAGQRVPVAVFNYVKVLKDYQKFGYFVGAMTKKKQDAMAPLAALRATILKLQEDLSKEPLANKRDELTKTLVAKQREFEDTQRRIEADLDTESAGFLRTAYVEIQKCVEAIVQQNGYDLVMAYPDAVDAKEMDNPLYFQAKLRTQAAMPFYVSRQADVTEVLIATLNRNFAAPVAPAGGVPPTAPPQPGK